MQSILDSLTKSFKLTTGLEKDLVERLSRSRLDLVLQDDAWSAYITGSRPTFGKDRNDAVPTVEQCMQHSLRRAAQALYAVYTATVGDLPNRPELDGPWIHETLVDYLCLDLQGLLLKYVKESSAYVAAVGLGQTETNQAALDSLIQKASASTGTLILSGLTRYLVRSGPLKSILKQTMFRGRVLLAGGNRSPCALRTLNAAQNILFIKRGMPCAEPWDVADAIRKHQVALSTEHKLETEKCDLSKEWTHNTQLLVGHVLDRIVDLVFGNKLYEPADQVPSINASFEQGRGEGGALRALAETIGVSSLCLSDSELLESKQLDRMVEDPCRPGRVFTLYRKPYIQRLQEEYTRRLENPIERGTLGQHGARYPGTNGYNRSIGVLPAAVIEPCKIRMITIGEAQPYTRALSLQKFLFRALSATEYFHLVGAPIDDDWWNRTYDPAVCHARTTQGWILVSGDYQASTDNIHPGLSERAWDRICSVVKTRSDSGELCPLEETSWASLGKKCLTGHDLYHGESRKSIRETLEGKRRGSKRASFLPQKWGQLMGSPVSFPILNLVNMAATVLALGGDSMARASLSRVRSVIDRHIIRTNGDDISFMCEPAQYETWKQVVSACGLAPSLGKNYTSKSFLIINSEMRALRPLPGPESPSGDPELGEYLPAASWTPIGFLNLGTLFGIVTKGGSDVGSSCFGTTAFFEAGPLARSLVWNCVSQDVADRRTRLFIEHWREVLNRAPPGVSWFAPQALGGLGLPYLGPEAELTPDYVRQIWAVFSCLDTKTRLKVVTPPSKTQFGVAKDMSQFDDDAVRITRVSLRTFYDDDNVAPRFRQKLVGGGDSFAAFLKYCDEIKTAVILNGEAQAPSEDRTIADRYFREKRYVRQLAKARDRYVQGSSLNPMSLETVRSWEDHRMLEEVTFRPSYSRASSTSRLISTCSLF